MKRNGRNLKILQSLELGELSRDSRDVLNVLEPDSIDTCDEIMTYVPEGDFERPCFISATQVHQNQQDQQIAENYCLEQNNIMENESYFEPTPSLLATLENMSLIDLNEDLHLSDSSNSYIPTLGECILSSTDCSNPETSYNSRKDSTLSRKHPYDVYEMGIEDFIDIKDLKTILVKNAKVDCEGNAVNWLKIRWLQYCKNDSKHIYFKYNLDDKEFKMIKVVRRGKRIAAEKNVLKNTYNGPLPISAEKYEDLQDLCRQGIIPTQYHNFYESFTIGTTNDGEHL